MKNLSIKKIFISFFTFLFILPLFLFCSCGGGNDIVNNKMSEKITEFHEVVTESQKLLDEVADDIYSYWYDAIYEDKYYGSISIAVATAKSDNKANLATIDENEPIIKELYKEIRDSELSTEIKAVMSAYTDYYELVVNVSGSFKSYSADKETFKKELASALKNLALEL